MLKRLLAISTLLLVLLIGCAKAEQKPIPAPETIVVPEVSSIPFDLVEQKDAPDVVRKMIMTMEDKEFINWISHADKGYIMLMPDTKNEKSTITIDRIEQRVPDKDYAWLNVKLKYVAVKEDEANLATPVIARFDLNNTPNAVGFQLDRLDLLTSPSSEQPGVVSRPPVSRPIANGQTMVERAEEIKGAAIKISEPVAGDAVTSPVQVKGEVGLLNGEVRIRLKDSNGKVLAEKPVEVKEKQIDTALSFVPPAEEQQGVVEAFLINPIDHTEVSRISIYVTLMPSKG